MRLDCRKDIQSVKSAWLVLHAELKACVLPPYPNRGMIKDVLMNTYTEKNSIDFTLQMYKLVSI